MNEPTKEEKPITIENFLEKYKSQISAALPKHMTADRVLRIVLAEIRKTPKLRECDPRSLLSCVIQASLLGLNIGGVIGECYLIPYGRECQFILGYKGMLSLAYRSDRVNTVSANCVYENDQFEFQYGNNAFLRHIPSNGDRGKLIAVYAEVRLGGNNYLFHVLWEKDIERAKSQSKSANRGPWATHRDEMAMKTAIRRLFKYMPMSIEMQKAIALDESADDGRQSEIIDSEAIIDIPQNESFETKSEEIANTLG